MTSDNLKILHVFDHSLPIHSGYSFRSISLLREQRKRGWYTCHLTTPRHIGNGTLTEEVDGFRFYRTPSLSSAMKGAPVLRELALIRAVARRIREVADVERPDVLHAHSPVLNALACLLAARKLRLPVVYEVRAFWEDAAVSLGTASEDGPRYKVTRALETYAFKRCAAITTICDGLRQEILGRGIPPERITVIPNGVDVEEFAFDTLPDQDLRRSLGLEGDIVLGFLGSFYDYEGIDDLLSALPAVLEKLPNVAVLLAGGGPVEDALKAQARRLKIDHAVHFVGRVPHDIVKNYYSIIDILVYPRRRMRLTETVTPLKPLEAMARGGVVLASDVGGHRELVRDRATGYLFPAGNVEGLVSAILEIIAGREDWRSVAETARRFVEDERRWTVTTAGYETAYARALRATEAMRDS